MVLTALLAGLLAVLSSSAWAGPAATQDSLDRLEEVLELRIDDGRLKRDALVPAILVSTQPRYEESADWFATRAIEVLTKVLGDGNLRLCEACMAPRAWVEHGQMVYQTGPVGLDEVVRLDEQTRGNSQPARAAIWVDEHAGGVSIRIVDLRTGQVLLAQNLDPTMRENANTKRMYSLAAEYERRARGDSLTQAFVDIVVFPGQHVSLDWTDQWGKTNANLSGFSISLFDPVIGVGGCHYRRVDVGNVLIGGKLLLSMPTTLVRAFGQDPEGIFDPLLTAVGVVRIPFGRSNYGAVMSLSTNGRLGFGISLMNISLLPVIP